MKMKVVQVFVNSDRFYEIEPNSTITNAIVLFECSESGMYKTAVTYFPKKLEFTDSCGNQKVDPSGCASIAITIKFPRNKCHMFPNYTQSRQIMQSGLNFSKAKEKAIEKIIEDNMGKPIQTKKGTKDLKIPGVEILEF